MLIEQSNVPERGRNLRRERKLWDQPVLTPSLGCRECPNFEACGGLHTRMGLYDCLGQCCGKPESCTTMCRTRSGDFTQKMREIGGFGFENVPRTTAIAVAKLPTCIPVLFHGNRRDELFEGPAVSLSLFQLFDKATGQPKFETPEALRQSYRLGQNTQLILTGTAQDPPLERWWAYGEITRRAAIENLVNLGIELVTTPNYSVFADTPRWDNLHAMKRIAIVHSEFQAGGLATALHVNGRTEADFRRWADLVSERNEITHLAYEFTTGAGRAERKSLHIQWLRTIAERANRPLTIVLRGGLDALPALSQAFEAVVVLESSAFMKAMKRQRAVAVGNVGVRWEPCPTHPGESLGGLFEANSKVLNSMVSLLAAHSISTGVKAAA